jgi:ribose transport system substrate-binding protein
MGRRIVVWGLLLISLFLVPSCTKPKAANESNASAASASNGSNKKILKVGFTVQDLTIPYFISLIRGINDHAKEYGIEVRVHDGKSDATSQVTAIENFTTEGVDAIVICPIDPKAPEGAVKGAHAAKIPVISWSEFVNGSDAFLTLKQHEYGFTAGKIAGDWIKKNLAKESDAKVMFVYVPEVAALAERGQGLKDGLKSVAPNATIIAEQAGNTPEAGMKAVETVLTKHRDMNVIVCCNDAVALGAYEAMAAAGRKAGDVCIVGLDATDEAIKKIKGNTMLVGTVDIGAYDQGVKFLKLVRKVVEEGPQKDPEYVDFVPVTKENINKY